VPVSEAFHCTGRVRSPGTLTCPPTFRQTAQSTPVCTFDLQVDGAGRESACVIRVVVLGTQAEASAQQLGRTSVVFLAGHLRQSERVTPGGMKRRTLEVVAERGEFLSEPAGRTGQIARAFIAPPPCYPRPIRPPR
jgi:single-stranded DNA-binding protein